MRDVIEPTGAPARVVGRYALYDEIAAGGMATVHIGRMLGPVGFARTIVIKRLHGHLARDPEFISMLLDEARLAARIHHTNVVSTLDVVTADGEVLLVLDYVQGESLSQLLKAARARGERIAPRIAASVMVGALHGLHAAHEAMDEHGVPLGIVHRDVSPHNILVGVDGVPRVLDFGVAKAAGRLQSTRDGQLKGKLAYMSPEQVRGIDVDLRTDVYAASAVLWECLTGRRLVRAENEGSMVRVILDGGFTPPSRVVPELPAGVDEVVMRGLHNDPAQRFATARDMAIALERALPQASAYEVGEWVRSLAPDTLSLRAARVKEMESSSAVSMVSDTALTLAEPSASAPDHAVITSPSRTSGGASATTPPRARGPSRALWIATGVSSALAIAAVSAVVVTALGTRGPAVTQPTASSVAAAPAVSAARSPTPSALAAAPSVALPAATVPDAPSATAAPVVELPPAASAARPASRPKPVSGAVKPAACDSPFYVDAQGIKHIKPECM